MVNKKQMRVHPKLLSELIEIQRDVKIRTGIDITLTQAQVMLLKKFHPDLKSILKRKKKGVDDVFPQM